MSKGSVDLSIPIIGRMIMICDKLLLRTRVSFDGTVTRKKIFLESGNCIETHIYVFVEVLEVHISVNFDLCLDEEFI